MFYRKHLNSKSASLQEPGKTRIQPVDKVLSRNGNPLSYNERSFFDSRFGTNFPNVRIHDDKAAHDAAEKIEAQAFTIGNNIVLGNAEVGSKEELLAHELTHVIQQTKATGIPDSLAKNEEEANKNSKNISGDDGITVNTTSSTGIIQRKPKSKINIENSGTKKEDGDKPVKTENKFSFSAETKVPLPGNREFGKLNLFDDLDLKISGEKTADEPISVPVDMETLKIKIAMQLAKLELEKVKNTDLGKFSAGAKLDVSSSLTLKFGEGNSIEGEAGSSAGFSLGYKSPNLVPEKLGSLGAEANLEGTGSYTGTVSDEESKLTPKLSSKAGLGLKYSTPSFASGLLGDKATVDFGAGAEVSGNISSEKRGIKTEGSGSIGVTGKDKSGIERFVKIKITKDVTLDQKAGEARTHGGSVMIGGFIGGTF